MSGRKTNVLILSGILFCSTCILWLVYGLKIEIPCLFKTLTGIPCPGCGGMRTLDALVHGELYRAMAINPLSALLILGFIISGLWLLWDIIRNTETFTNAIKKLNDRHVLWTVILLLILNWIRNIIVGI